MISHMSGGYCGIRLGFGSAVLSAFDALPLTLIDKVSMVPDPG